ncbi:cytochrome P450 4C1-like [Chrysoperla carnea]|uniref:cytochrome P450 4C1-like n=1 Tax=Chrysoperla carnea TaxID=189513 RepID=UPI001D097E2D|nr:cytochrome P450 4C1-like [Chrysoperla carnea]
MIPEVIIFILTLILVLWVYFDLPIIALTKLTEPIPGPKSLPIVGNILDIGREKEGIFEFLKKLRKTFGTVFKIHVPGRITVFLCDPEDIEMILRSNEVIEKPTTLDVFLKPWLGDGIFLSKGSHWRETRKLVTPAFHFDILQKFFEVFVEQTNVLIDILKEHANTNKNFDIGHIMKLFALDVICETAMGVKIESQTKLEGNAYVEAVDDLQRIVINRGLNFLQQIPFIFPYTKAGRKQEEALKILNTHTTKIIQQRREELIENNNNNIIDDNSNVCLGSKKRIIFLDLLLQSTHLSGEPLTDKEIIDEVTNFMFAGHDTTSVQLSLLMYLLCEHPEIQNELYKEQCAILTDINGDPSFKQIQEMNYLERTIKESQRILPCVISFSRKMTADIQLKTNNFLLPKGCTASIFVYDVHHNPKIYENPEKFDPDRFLPENIRGRHPYAYIPFSAGPRNCLGQKFALLEMKTVMSNIIRNFKILPAYEDNGDKFKPIFRRYMLLTSLNGIQIRLESRR